MIKAIISVIIGLLAILSWIYLCTKDLKTALALAIIFWANNIYALNKRD